MIQTALRPSPVRGRGLLLGLMLALVATLATAAPKFPPLTGRVVDDARMLKPSTEQALTEKLAALEAQTGAQLVVATVPDLQGYEIEDFGYQLGRTWALGQKGKNNGAILLVAPKERKVRIEVGYGLEPVLTDALSNVILQQKVLPEFREGRMEQGVVDGAEALIEQLSLPEDEAKAVVAQAAKKPVETEDEGATFLIFLAVIAFWIVIGILRGGRRGRRGGGAWWLLPLLLSGSSHRGGGGWGGGGGGFSGGGGSFGGGGSSGSW